MPDRPNLKAEPQTWVLGGKNRKHSLLYSLQRLVQCVNPSLQIFVPVWAPHLPFSCSETCRVYLFIRFALIRTFALKNAEVVALAPSLHPLSPECQPLKMRKLQKENKRWGFFKVPITERRLPGATVDVHIHLPEFLNSATLTYINASDNLIKTG